ncbi:MAG: phosphoglucomutase/phosphomannomutase family protein [Verrucomicrobia bacterium]|nr:phosphoglucomutase/phosphomannomutase family protein [Verrucomicrobiota bacterium]
MSVSIKFGTSGWRGLIARDFTFDRAQLVTQAIADHLSNNLKDKNSDIHGRKPIVIVGHDTRFLGRDLALAACAVLQSNQIQPLLCNRDTPTPVISHAIRTRKAIGGINFTASHNPAEYQGIKFSTSNGAPAPESVTHDIEARINTLLQKGWTFDNNVHNSIKFKEFDPQPAYFKQIRKLINFDVISKAGLRTALEFMYGTGHGYLDTLLEEAGAKVIKFHDYINPLFGGRHPEPDAGGMCQVIESILKRKASLGLGLDGDADRFGIVDKTGTWLSPNQILPLALYHLKKNRGWSGSVVRTIPTSHMVNAVADWLNVEIRETPVGFKHIGAIMESEPVIVGGEESGGLSVKGHIPEKDGILACLLMAELVATEKKSLGKILEKIEKQVGSFFTDRINLRLSPDKKASFLEELAEGPGKIAGSKVEDIITKDGFKFILSGGQWVAFRASGTEPLIRCYIEAKSKMQLGKLKSACRKLVAS